MLRIATKDDALLIKEMVLRFASDIPPYAPYVDEGKIEAVIEEMLSSDPSEKIVILHGEAGLVAGIIAPIMFGTAKLATEVMWWVDPAHRSNSVGLELLQALEAWARAYDCKLISMISLDDSVGKIYEKYGYTLCERTYLKGL